MLIIVRHGRTAANASGLLQGRADNPLDDEGRRQADDIAAALGSVDVVVSSPLRRAVETAAPLGIEPRIDDRWIEIDYGEWEARPVADVPAATWAAWQADPDFALPGGESLSALNRRVGAACAELVAEAREVDVAVFTHVSPIKSAVAWSLGVSDELSWRLHVAQAQITRIAFRGDRPALTSFNDTAHLQ